MSKFINKTICAMLLGLFLMISCAINDTASVHGPGTEVIGKVISPEQSHILNAEVLLRKVDYLADTSGAAYELPQTITNKDGEFYFENVAPGAYVIEARDSTLKPGSVYSLLARFEIGAVPQYHIPSDTLRPTGVITGLVTGYQPGERIFVRAYGLERLAVVESNGHFVINDMPQGIYSLQVMSSSPLVKPYELDSIAVNQGDTVEIPFASWRYSRRIVLNTTLSGADVSENVYAFPLLLRLDTSNFDFNQASDSGQDIRLTKQNGTMLPFQIESWDRQANRAVVWARVDTVQGNNSSQYISLYWGNASALSVSKGRDVFGTTDGFVGAWHLNEEGTAVAQEFTDASESGFDGQGGGGTLSSTPSREDGPLGSAQRFDGQNDYIAIDSASILTPSPFMTISAWVMFDTLSSQKGELQNVVVKLHNFDHPYKSYSLSLDSADRIAFTWVDQSGESHYARDTARDVTTKTWYHLTGVKDQSEIRLYVNGSTLTTTSSAAVLPSFPSVGKLHFGAVYNGGQRLAGVVDEVQLSSVARPASWIRLSYMNQRVDNKLVQWK